MKNKQEQEQISPNHVQAFFPSSVLIHPISHTMRKFSNFRKMCQGWNVLQGISIAIKFKQQSTGSCDRDNSYTENGWIRRIIFP